ncbi:unnamed protein product, partial [Staurois parvus]
MISVPQQCHDQCPHQYPNSAYQCHINTTYQCLPVHINATYQCPSELPFIASQCHLSMPNSASQCPISAIYQCCLSVPISDPCQCPSV